ncbi:MAG: rhodanese-like domain-containing protein [Rhodovibrio sp.]|nr:rhodanese-like domain-containing protein [Rhodovibrio sp.]
MTLARLTRRALRRAGLPPHGRPAPITAPRRPYAAERDALMSEHGYAGDVSPDTAWEILQDDPTAKLVDVRTEPEITFVGLPDLGALDKAVVTVAWKTYPGMAANPRFVEEVAAAGVQPADTVLLLCRSGQRSAAAAKALSARGFQRCYNVAEGFEGDKDADGHRASHNGWKVRGLPWSQD